VGAGDQVTGFADGEAFVVDHGKAVGTRSGGTFRDLCKLEIHGCKLGCRSETGKKGWFRVSMTDSMEFPYITFK